MSRLRIQQLQWIGAVAVIMVCLMMAGSTIAFSLSDYLNYKRGVMEFGRFHTALHAAAMISRERGPANSLMGAADGEQAKYAATLRVSREATDKDIAKLEALFKAEIDQSAEMRSTFMALRAQLASGRQTVDAVASLPRDERSGTKIAGAIQAMFRAADRAQDYRDIAGRSVIALASETSAKVMLTSMAGTLRERAGRLGSYVVMMLTSQGQARSHYRAAFDSELNRLFEVNALLKTYAPVTLQSPEVARLLDEVTVNYFAGALPYAQRVVFDLNGSDGLTSGEFTAKYVPGMKSTEDLRELIETAALSSFDEIQQKSLRAMLISALLAGTAICVMIGSAYVLRRSLFGPMLAVMRQLDEIATGNLATPAPIPHAGREMRELLHRLDFLREQQRSKHRLEMERKSLTDELRRLSQTDALTGLLNRRALEKAVEELFSASTNGTRGIAAVMLDIDHFKSINDRYGHAIGDTVLQKVAQILGICLRPADLFARYGGEEFIIVMADVTEAFACSTAERLRETLAQAVVSEEHGLKVTASFGVDWQAQCQYENWEKLALVADNRLYQAKRNGRNLVCSSDNISGQAVARTFRDNSTDADAA